MAVEWAFVDYCGGGIDKLDLEEDDYRLELCDYGCSGDDDDVRHGPYLTFDAEGESSTLSLEHTGRIVKWLALWQDKHASHG